MVDLIRKQMKASQDRRKSYTDMRRTDLEFSESDLVFVKISLVTTRIFNRLLNNDFNRKFNFEITTQFFNEILHASCLYIDTTCGEVS